jgi:hypothetical protein
MTLSAANVIVAWELVSLGNAPIARRTAFNAYNL